MRRAMLLTALLFGTGVFANTYDMSFRCTNKSIETCESKVLTELNNQGCRPLANSVRCEKIETSEDKAIYCGARAERCKDASSDGFTGVTCPSGSEKVRIKDSQLSADWARTMFWIWVKDMCKI